MVAPAPASPLIARDICADGRGAGSRAPAPPVTQARKDYTMAFEDLFVDVEAEDEGEWVEYPKNSAFKVKLRSTNYPPFQKARAAAVARLRKAHRDGEIPSTLLAQATGKLMAEHLIVDMKLPNDRSGKPVKFSREIAVEIMTERKGRLVQDWIAYEAQRIGEREAVDFEEDAGNSARASSGTPPTAKT